MKLLIKFPTRNRPQKFLNVLRKYVDYLNDKNNYEIIISCDDDDESMKQDFVVDVINDYNNVKLFYNNTKTKIEAINANMDNIDFDILLLASDDMIPLVKGFDDIIREDMNKYFTDTDGILWYNDGHQGNRLNTLCILGKKYYDRFKYIYNPEYKSFYSDNEFMEVGNILNKQKYIDNVIIEHQHPDYGYKVNDNLYNKNAQLVNYDLMIYNKRKSINFNLNLNSDSKIC
jgi:hypothetical protein